MNTFSNSSGIGRCSWLFLVGCLLGVASFVSACVEIPEPSDGPMLQSPTGPGEVAEVGVRAYETIVSPGEPLDFTVRAVDRGLNAMIEMRAEVSGGTLNALAAGFITAFPRLSIGSPPVELRFAGTADRAGTIEITVTADDGGRIETLVHTIQINAIPNLQPPTGPGTMVGSVAPFETLVNVGDRLDFSVTATDPDPGDELTLTAEIAGGSLGAAEAGFVTEFPAQIGGPSPQTLEIEGTAAVPGTVEVTVTADDGRSTASWLLVIRINAATILAPPTGPGSVTGSGGMYETILNIGDPLDFEAIATDADVDDTVSLAVSTVSGGTTTPAALGFTSPIPTSTSGPSPQSLSFTGTAAAAALVILEVVATDGHSTDSWTLQVRVNAPPTLGAPAGPGSVTGGPTHYESTIEAGDPLAFSIVANDTDSADLLTLTATVVGGTLSAAQAGFATAFPHSDNGSAPLDLSFTGTAGTTAGTIELEFLAEDNHGATATATLEITILAEAPAFTNEPWKAVEPGRTWSYSPAATGTPAPTITCVGHPTWLTWDGTTLFGVVPTGFTGSTGTITFTASNGVAPDAQLPFTLTAVAWHLESIALALNGVHGSASNNIITVGNGGMIWEFDGSQWRHIQTPTTIQLNDVWVNSPTHAFAAGNSGVILQYDGMSWSMTNTPSTMNVAAVWAESPTQAIAVSNTTSTAWRLNGSTWTTVFNNIVNDVWGTTIDNVYGVGNNGLIRRYNGSTWSTVSSPTSSTLNAIWGTSPNDIYAVGLNGTIIHFDGATWSVVATQSGISYTGITGTSSSNMLISSSNAGLFHFDGNTVTPVNTSGVSGTTNFRDVWMDSSGAAVATGVNGTLLHRTGSVWSVPIPAFAAELRAMGAHAANDWYLLAQGIGTSRHDGTGWQQVHAQPQNATRAVWAASSTQLFAVGETSQMIMYFDGTGWVPMSTPVTVNLNGVWGSSFNNVFAIGNSGTILHFNGFSWSTMSSGTSIHFHAVWGSAPDNVFAVGNSGTIRRFNGSTWTNMSTPTSQPLNAIWGTSADNVFAVGNNGTILHYDGVSWTQMSSGGVTASLFDVRGVSPTTVFAVGTGSTVLRFDGTTNTWFQMTTEIPSQTLFAVWATSDTDIRAVGNNGVIIHCRP